MDLFSAMGKRDLIHSNVSANLAPRNSQSLCSLRHKESGMILFIVLGLIVVVLGVLYAGHMLITCYRFAQFQNTLRSYIGMEATVDDLLKEDSVAAYISSKDSGIQLIRSIHSMLKRGDFDNAEKRLKPIAASDTNAQLRIAESLQMLGEARVDLKQLKSEWDNLVRVRAKENKEYLKLRQDTATLLSTRVTENELPTELNEVDVVSTGPLPFYELGELVGIPVLHNIPDNLDKKTLIATLASTYKKSIARVGKVAAGDPAADYRHIQTRARHLRRRNEKSAEALFRVHSKIMENKLNSRNARNSIQGLLYVSLENRKRPELPKWVPELYGFIRHHARKFGHVLPPVEMAPSY